MTAILLVSHGGFAQALLETAEMILGPQELTAAVGLGPTDSPETLQTKIEAALDAFHGAPTLVLTDIFSGTPFNTVVRLSQSRSFRHLTGINLPLLNEALVSRDFSSPDELAESLMESAPDAFQDVDALMSRAPQPDDLDDF